MISRQIVYTPATITRLLKIIGLFCKRALQNRLYFAKEAYKSNEDIGVQFSDEGRGGWNTPPRTVNNVRFVMRTWGFSLVMREGEVRMTLFCTTVEAMLKAGKRSIIHRQVK